ncbi:hypothetical protein Tco_1049838 [Tanacetum coccineum]
MTYQILTTFYVNVVEICKGMHLDKECPFKKEVNRAKEAKYDEFRRPFLNNSSHGWYREIKDVEKVKNGVSLGFPIIESSVPPIHCWNNQRR